jgi:hypothetical protein
MRLLTGPGVFTKRCASFTPGLAARLVDTCLHELPRLLRIRPYTPSSSSSPVAAWPAAQPRAQHLPPEVSYRGGSDCSRSSCATRPAARSPRTLAARRKGSTNTPWDNAAADTSRTLVAGELKSAMYRCKPILPKFKNSGNDRFNEHRVQPSSRRCWVCRPPTCPIARTHLMLASPSRCAGDDKYDPEEVALMKVCLL